MRARLEAIMLEIFDLVPFQESKQLGIVEHTEAEISAAHSRPGSLRYVELQVAATSYFDLLA